MCRKSKGLRRGRPPSSELIEFYEPDKLSSLKSSENPCCRFNPTGVEICIFTTILRSAHVGEFESQVRLIVRLQSEAEATD